MKKILLIILAVIVLSVGVFATTDLKIEDLIIPDSYSELVEAYKSIASIAISYQRLYNEAEADNDVLMESIRNLQDLMKVQQDIIDDLLNKDEISIFGGINYVPMHPDYSGIMLGVMFEF